MKDSPSAALKLANTVEDLEIVGGLLAGTADALGLEALERNDLQTAVMEACKNVVWHAYEGVRGPLEVEVHPGAGMLEVVVRDHGIGIRPHVGERTLPHTGIGMPIAHLLTRRITYTNVTGGGTEVRMEFSMPGVAWGGTYLAEGVLERFAADDREESILLALAGGPLCAAVLPLVLAAMASRSGLEPVAVAAVRQRAGGAVEVLEDAAADGRLALHARAVPGGLDIAFSELGEQLEQRLRAAFALAEGAVPLPAIEESGEAGERLTLRLRSGGPEAADRAERSGG